MVRNGTEQAAVHSCKQNASGTSMILLSFMRLVNLSVDG